MFEREPIEKLVAEAPGARVLSITASGRRWTRCATSSTWKNSGAAERRHGRRGSARRASGAASASSSPDTRASKAAGLRSGSHRRAPSCAAMHSIPIRSQTSSKLRASAARVEDIRGDIRDAPALEPALREFAPEVVFHMAAQPLVRASYAGPHRHVRDERHRHSARAGCGAAHAFRARRRQRDDRQVLRESGVAVGLSRERSARRIRPVLELQGLRGDRLRGVPAELLPCRKARGASLRRSRPRAPATSSAAATGRPTA